MPAFGYVQDVVTRIINVQWSKIVIVVFVNDITASSYANLKCTPIDDKATRLKDFIVTISKPEYLTVKVDCSAFSLSTDAGEFMETLVADITDPNTVFSTLTVLVFAIIGDAEESLDAAIKGTTDFLTDRMYGSGNLYPDGLRWSVLTVSTPPGSKYTWKMRSGNHRTDEDTTPPNSMVQCYPISIVPVSYKFLEPPFGFIQTTRGYRIDLYRLDAEGTGQVYIGSDEAGPAPWNQVVADVVFQQAENPTTTHYHGVPFADVPPLIAADIPRPGA